MQTTWVIFPVYSTHCALNTLMTFSVVYNHTPSVCLLILWKALKKYYPKWHWWGTSKTSVAQATRSSSGRSQANPSPCSGTCYPQAPGCPQSNAMLGRLQNCFPGVIMEPPPLTDTPQPLVSYVGLWSNNIFTVEREQWKKASWWVPVYLKNHPSNSLGHFQMPKDT